MPSSLPIKELLNSSANAALTTYEVLTFPVDYNDGAAAVVPAGTVFARQADITAFLAAHSATNFKYLMDCWDALPDLVAHDITFNLATGVHRPRATEVGPAAFTFSGKLFPNYSIVRVWGVTPSQYTTIVGTQTITALGGSTDPYIDVAGTPFSGLDLRGYYVVFDTGQVTLIHQHTSSRLKILDGPSPTPTTFVVARPATILRNSLDDINPAKPQQVMSVSLKGGTTFGNALLVFRDMRIDTFGSNWSVYPHYDGTIYFFRALFDHVAEFTEFGVTGYYTRVTQPSGVNSGLSGTHWSVRGPAMQGIAASSSPISLWGATAVVSSCYFGGVDYSFIGFAPGWMIASSTVFDQCPGGGLYIGDNGQFTTQDNFYPNNRVTTLRNCQGLGGIDMYSKASFGDAYGTEIWFENCSDCLVIEDLVMGFNWADVVLKNGPDGGNTGFGIKLTGLSSTVRIAPTTNISGTLGDVRMADNTVLTYANIVTAGVVEDSSGNIVKKAS